MTKITLEKEQLTLLSAIIQIEEKLISKLIDRGVFCQKGARCILLTAEYNNMSSKGNISKTMIVNVLMDKYKLSRSSVEKIIYYKKIKI